ncbi:MAG: acetylglucosamine-6-sulfatase, partial [Bacteroidota bacterium]
MKNLIILLFLIFLINTNCSPPQNIQERPNILFILSDDHTSQAWGIYGGVLQDYVKNEHIKRIASEGALLENVFCTNSICVP